MDYPLCRLIGKEELIVNLFSMVLCEETDVYNRKSYCAEGLIKAHLQGFKTCTAAV